MFAVGDTGEMLAARTACNIVCGGYILMNLGNNVFNGVRLFMCAASVASLDASEGSTRVAVAVEEPDTSSEPLRASPPRFSSLVLTMALAWSQVAIAVAVGTTCMTIIAHSEKIEDIVLNFLAMLVRDDLCDRLMASHKTQRSFDYPPIAYQLPTTARL